MQSPQNASDKAIWASAKAIMEASAQRFNLTDLSTRRDMSMLLAQSAVQVGAIVIINMRALDCILARDEQHVHQSR